jgi:hypothetical protein
LNDDPKNSKSNIVANRAFYPIVSNEINIMYSYGPSSGDYLLPKYDDNFEGPIELGVSFPFFKNVFSTIFISTNGVVSFLSPISKPCSLKKYPITTALISPFWSDINTLIGGRIYYRESSTTSDLNQAKNDIASIYSTAFNPSRLYIITWDRVAAFDGRPSLNNTFQLVIATDGKLSFLIFNFGIMSWPNSKFTMNSFFGYNAGDNINYYSYPDSFTNNIINVASKSNVNIPGKWIFMVSLTNSSTTSTTKSTSTTRTTSTTSTTSTTRTTSITSSSSLYTSTATLSNCSSISTLACEHYPINLFCSNPFKVVKVISSNYGRLDSTTCFSEGEVSNTSCVKSVTNKLNELCFNSNNCSFNAENTYFGDPCYLTYKYLQVDYCCVDPTPINVDPIPAIACEHYSLNISCSFSQNIKIINANYGRLNNSICCQFTNPDYCLKTDCIFNATNIVSSYCNSNSCLIPSSNSVFGDPCFLTYKYLKVEYICV